MNNIYFLAYLLVNLTLLIGQDFSLYENLIREGKIEEVQRSVQYLKSQHPNHPFVLYLEATVENDADLAMTKFQSLVEKHPNTLAGELSNLKIYEYLYSKGLYTQASNQLKTFPYKYPESENIEQVFHEIMSENIRITNTSLLLVCVRKIYYG